MLFISCVNTTGGDNSSIKPTSIIIKTPPDKREYGLNESPNWTGLEVLIVYSDGSTGTESVSDFETSGFDSSSMGEKTITVTKTGLKATFTITVSATVLVSIEISRLPGKRDYGLNESPDWTGLEVSGNYSDGSSAILSVNNSDMSGFDSTSAGEKTITVTRNGLKATFTITVSAETLVSLSISIYPDKRVYEMDENPDWTGLVVIGTYSSGIAQFETIGNSDISGFDSTSAGTKTIVITKNGQTVSFTVEILDKGRGGITIQPPLMAAEDIVLVLSQAGNTAIAPVGYDSYQWFVNDFARPADSGNGGREITLTTPSYVLGKYRVRIIAYKQGLPYSGEIAITLQ
jgi:hypothetical protein